MTTIVERLQAYDPEKLYETTIELEHLCQDAAAEIERLRRAAAHLCAFDWESATSPAGADLNARILALRAELDR